jgi:hypothetical protein
MIEQTELEMPIITELVKQEKMKMIMIQHK